ncbi:MAG: NAD(P)-dependent alcohol dehydrogenase [Bacillaceae bacterium]|nr:NAD(P)-dependent alcohol dehydrogenase [Bacillaceae bacterium]
MKAIVNTEYGQPEVLQLKEIDKPQPKENELLIRVYATAVNSGDIHLRKADPFAVRLFFGLLKPKKPVLGAVLAGEVEEVGENVKDFKVGDRVFGMTGMAMGAYAEYKCLPENACLALIPENMNYEEAASVPFGATTALHFLKKANIKKGQKVLIYGASGAVGTAAVQLASHFGAEVTGVCSSANLSLVKSLGADHVIDYTTEDFTENGEIYDLIFVTVNKISFHKSIKSLDKRGTLILGAAGPAETLKGIGTRMTGTRNVIFGVNAENKEDMIFLKELIEKGEFVPVIDKMYKLEEMVEAHRYVEKGHKKGNVVVKI